MRRLKYQLFYLLDLSGDTKSLIPAQLLVAICHCYMMIKYTYCFFKASEYTIVFTAKLLHTMCGPDRFHLSIFTNIRQNIIITVLKINIKETFPMIHSAYTPSAFLPRTLINMALFIKTRIEIFYQNSVTLCYSPLGFTVVIT